MNAMEVLGAILDWLKKKAKGGRRGGKPVAVQAKKTAAGSTCTTSIRYA